MSGFVMSKRVLAGSLLLLSLAALARAEGDLSSTKGRTAKSKKPVSAKALDGLLKSQSVDLWDKGLSSVTSDALDDDGVVKALANFAGRESHAERITPFLVKSIALLAEARQPIALDQLSSL